MSESLEEMVGRMSPPSHIVFTSSDRAVFRSEDRLTITILGRFHGEEYWAALLRPEGLPWSDEDCVLAMNMTCDIALRKLERGDRSDTTARRFPLGAGWWLYTWANTGPPTWPWDVRFHQWRPVEGIVQQTNSRLISDGKSVSQRIVVSIDGKPYGCDDARCTLLQHGDRVALTCKPEYQWAGESGEACEFVGSTRTGDMPS